MCIVLILYYVVLIQVLILIEVYCTHVLIHVGYPVLIREYCVCTRVLRTGTPKRHGGMLFMYMKHVVRVYNSNTVVHVYKLIYYSGN